MAVPVAPSAANSDPEPSFRAERSTYYGGLPMKLPPRAGPWFGA
jgi:hypothetical protein